VLREPIVGLYLVACCIQLVSGCSNSNVRTVVPGTSIECSVKGAPACAVEQLYTDDSTAFVKRETFEILIHSGFDSTLVSVYLNATRVFEGYLTSDSDYEVTGSRVDFYADGLFLVEQYDWKAEAILPSEWLRLGQSIDSVALCIDGCLVSTPIDRRYKTLIVHRNPSTGNIRLWHCHEFMVGF
jgi:hypothetical protein